MGFSGKIFAILAMMLALANAQCLLRCQLDSSQRSAPPCHSQSKASVDHCIEQHDASAAAAPVTEFAAFMTDTASLAMQSEIVFAASSSDSSPALHKTSQPLRI